MCQRISKRRTCKSNVVAISPSAFARYLVLTIPRPDRPASPQGRQAWGWHIRQVRRFRGIDPRQAAKEIGIARQTLYGWESGDAVPKVIFIPGIVKFLGYVPICFSPYQATLGACYRAARELRGLRITDLAALAGLGFKQVWNVENDRGSVSSQGKIERALSIPVRKCFLSHNKGQGTGL